MSRSRKEFSVAVRKARLEHCKDKQGQPRCEGCGKPMRKGGWHFDHHLPDGLSGQPTFENCRVLCCDGATSCHAIKTERDKALMQKADNIKNHHEGTKAAPKATIPAPPKSKREPTRLASALPTLPRRELFR